MIWFPGASSVLLVLFFCQKNYNTEEPLKLTLFTAYLHFCKRLKGYGIRVFSFRCGEAFLGMASACAGTIIQPSSVIMLQFSEG
jgi:hypothetical protein